MVPREVCVTARASPLFAAVAAFDGLPEAFPYAEPPELDVPAEPQAVRLRTAAATKAGAARAAPRRRPCVRQTLDAFIGLFLSGCACVAGIDSPGVEVPPLGIPTLAVPGLG